MGRSISVLRAQRRAERRRIRNRILKTRIKTAIKKFLKAGTLEEKRRLLQEAYSLLDKGVSKGILHKNTAARKKSRLASILVEMEKSQPSS
jgi:small subunit ribosomal protein S20